MNAGSNHLMVGGSCNQENLPNAGCIGEVAIYDKELNKIDYSHQNMNDNRFAIEDVDKIWFADSYHGYRYIRSRLQCLMININDRSHGQ